MKEKFKVEFLKEVFVYLNSLDSKARAKILFDIDKAKFQNGNTLLIKLTSDIWEFRTLYNKMHYRLFAFWDKTDDTVTIVVATHDILRKSQKTSKKEIKKAIKLTRLYFRYKNRKR